MSLCGYRIIHVKLLLLLKNINNRGFIIAHCALFSTLVCEVPHLSA